MPARMKSRLAPIAVALVVIGAAGACDSTTGADAVYPIYSVDSQTVYALNGSPSGAPTALSLFGGVVGTSLVPAGANFAFDLAFDINDAGEIVLLPARTVAGGLSSPHSVGLQKVAAAYETIDRAPDDGYRFDSTMVVNAGDVVVVQSNYGTGCTSFYQTPVIYGKVTVRKIDLATRTLLLRYTADPNCGYKSLASGVPKY